jgi:vesicle coat complex subunit
MFCRIRLANIVEYIMGSLRQGLVDSSAYVRKTAVMGCAKLFSLVPNVIKGNIISTLSFFVVVSSHFSFRRFGFG